MVNLGDSFAFMLEMRTSTNYKAATLRLTIETRLLSSPLSLEDLNKLNMSHHNISFSKEEIERYSRHLINPEFNIEGQKN